MDFPFRDPEWIEIRREVPHHAIGADEHDRAHAVLDGAERSDRRDFEADTLRPRLQLVAQAALDLAVVPRQRRNELARRTLQLRKRKRPRRFAGASAVRLGGRVSAALTYAFEEQAPLVTDGAWILLILALHLFDVRRVDTVQEGCAKKVLVECLSRHVKPRMCVAVFKW
jgi:hypothetical protein